jgi:hypothetical protein
LRFEEEVIEFGATKPIPGGERDRNTLINMTLGTESRAMTMEEN